MATAAQILTNKQNAQHSTGPKSEAGKTASKFNALRHGLTSQAVVLPGEDAQAHAALHATFTRDFAPQGSHEQILVQTICDTQWRLERARNLEASLIALAHYEELPDALNAIADPDLRQAMISAHGYDKREKKIRNLQLQESRLQRALFQAMADLRQAQALRREQQQVALSNAVDHRKHCRSNNLPHELAASGFVFTEEQLDREEQRREAQNLRRIRPAGMNLGMETE